MFTDSVEVRDLPKMPEEYRELLTRLLTIQADCEIGGPHLYMAQWVLGAPTADDAWNVARTAYEEISHFRSMIKLLKPFGVDAPAILHRPKSERFVESFRCDMPTWADLAVFSLLIDRVGRYQLEEMVGCTYAPLRKVLADIISEEEGHVSFGKRKVQDLAKTREGKRQAQEAIDRWYPRALDMFGRSGSKRSERYIYWGMKRRSNEQARLDYRTEVGPIIESLGFQVPEFEAARNFL